jgi:hypothetical protein
VTVFKPKFVAWLVREGLLNEADVDDRDIITFALEAYLGSQYDLPDVPDEPQPHYAAGSFGAEFTAQRDRSNIVVGLLEREGQCASTQLRIAASRDASGVGPLPNASRRPPWFHTLVPTAGACRSSYVARASF